MNDYAEFWKYTVAVLKGALAGLIVAALLCGTFIGGMTYQGWLMRPRIVPLTITPDKVSPSPSDCPSAGPFKCRYL